MGYYDETNDRLELIYQYANNIKYFIVQNMKELFYFECEAKTVETISNQSLTFNVSELMTYPLEHKLLHKDNVVNYPSTNEKIWSYNGNINFNKASQILNVTTGLNDWMTLYFFFQGISNDNNITLFFCIPTCIINIRVCAFKCGSCSQDYNTCDPGICKKNFAMLRDSDDTDCYPNDQNIPNYIYNEATKYYEECYPSCKFCSKQKSLSSNINHNCLTCNDGYLKSYVYMGNCYLVDNLYNNSDTKKIVNNQTDEQYSIVELCLNKFIIASTGECISECPTNTVFYSYKYVYQNFTDQGTSKIGKMYPLTKETIL